MGTHTGSVLTLANSIIGVSVLAMPFCFKQCGIVLSIFMLILSNVVTRLACYYLIKSAIMEKRKNFEMLAFRVLGRSGKLIVELCIIGFMLGTCVAFFVVVGDLGPTILAEVIGVEHPSALRPSVLIGLGVFVVLPLGLLRNVESLSALCAASIAFYVCLVLKVMGEATSHLLAWDWMDKVSFWRPAGVLQCVPIFSMALSCQTQLFEVFDSLPSTPMERMNSIIRSAINMTTMFYIAVGFFGYVAFCNQPFSGNLLISLSPSVVSYIIKLGFVLSLAVSFPLVIFPCRASIYSLVFTSGISAGGEGSSHIPETKFQCITLLIVTLSLVTGLLVPSIEAVLGFIGSTIGFFVCIILPSIIFICLSKKNTSERLLAKGLACLGLIIMVLSTYANLTAVDSKAPAVIIPSRDIPVVVHPPLNEELEIVKDKVELESKLIDPKISVIEEDIKKLKDVKELKELVLPKKEELKVEIKEEPVVENKEVKSRQEPPNPVPEEPKVPPKKKKTSLVPPLSKIKNKIDIEEIKRSMEKLDLPKSAEAEKVVDSSKIKNITKNEEKIRIDSNLNVSEVSKSKVESVANAKNEDVNKNRVAASIANGVPLPLAIKGKDALNKNNSIDNKVIDREKRDIRTDSVELNEIKNSTKDIEKLDVHNKNEPINNSFIKSIEETAKINSNNEKCLKNDTEQVAIALQPSSDAIVTNVNISNVLPSPIALSEKDEPNKKIIISNADKPTMRSPINSDDLIKTPAYLSDPNLILDSKKILHGPEPKLPLESSNPLKRDLKSVPESLENNKIEHR